MTKKEHLFLSNVMFFLKIILYDITQMHDTFIYTKYK